MKKTSITELIKDIVPHVSISFFGDEKGIKVDILGLYNALTKKVANPVTKYTYVPVSGTFTEREITKEEFDQMIKELGGTNK